MRLLSERQPKCMRDTYGKQQEAVRQGEVTLISKPTCEREDEIATGTVANENKFTFRMPDAVLFDYMSVNRCCILHHCREWCVLQ